jgi:flagellar motility protein MotE (MotC chaperone)
MRTRPGSSLLSFALCALIVILVAKLIITVASSLSTREIVPAIPEVLAGEEKPKTAALDKDKPAAQPESLAAIPSEKPKNGKQSGTSTTDSITFLQQKEADIQRREEQLKEKEEHLANVQKEVEQKVKELLAIQKEIQASRNEKQESQNTKVRSLAKIYGTMKPKEAAKLFENLDDKLVMGIISTMTPDEAAAILALMEVKKAAKISEALSGR